MKITLLGEAYEVGDVTHDAPVGFVRELKKISGGKVTIKTIRDELSSIARRLEPEDFNEADLLDDETFCDNFQGMIWLVGRTYGHLDWTWADAGECANLAMLLSITEEVEVADESPKVLSGTVGAAPPHQLSVTRDYDLEQEIYVWVPVISQLFPGSGINPFTINALAFEWWEVFYARAEAEIAARKAAMKPARRRR